MKITREDIERLVMEVNKEFLDSAQKPKGWVFVQGFAPHTIGLYEIDDEQRASANVMKAGTLREVYAFLQGYLLAKRRG